MSWVNASAALPKKYNLKIFGGITINSGNTDSIILNGGIDFGFNSKSVQYKSLFETFYGKSNKLEIENRGKWSNQMNHQVTSWVELSGLFSLEYNRLANIRTRTTTGGGFQFYLVKSQGCQIKMLTSLNYELENPYGEGNKKESIRTNIAFEGKYSLSDPNQLIWQILYTPNISDFISDFRFEADISLWLKISQKLAIRIRLQDRYNHKPLLLTVKHNDICLITSLEFTL